MPDSATAGVTSRASVLAASVAFLLIAQQVGVKAVRDALFLSHFEASRLPVVMSAAALAGVVAALAAGALLSKFGPARCVPWLLGLHAALFGFEYLAAPGAPRPVAILLYVHVASLGAVLVSAFWSAINERFDPYSAKRVIGRIGAGATLGGVAGGLLTERLANVIPIEQMLLGLSAISLLAGACSVRLSAGAEPAARAATTERVAPDKVIRSRYLQNLALLVALMAIVDACLDYVFKAEASRTLGQGESLLGFFALFYTGTAILTFLVQTLLNDRILARAGLGGAIALLPGSVVLAGGLALGWPGLAAVAILRGASSVVDNSLYRSGYELLYTPLAQAEKRTAKAVLDVAIGRAGTIVGSGLTIGVLAIAPARGAALLVVASIALCVVALVVARRMHVGYVAQLAQSLRTGVVELDARKVIDRSTLRTLSQTLDGIDPEELRGRIQRAIAARSLEADVPRRTPRPITPRESVPALWLEHARALTSNDPERVRRQLATPLAPELIPVVVPMLADESLAPAVQRALAPLAKRHVGQLLDALLDARSPEPLRRRLPAVLTEVDGERVERGLFAALGDPSPQVRRRAAAALEQIAARSGRPAFSEDELFEAIRRELDRHDQPAPDASAGDDGAERTTVEQVFAILALGSERRAVALSMHAIFGDDSRLRGTALEYLDNVLPNDIRDRLWPRLRAARSSQAPPRSRSRHELVEELRASIVLPSRPTSGG